MNHLNDKPLITLINDMLRILKNYVLRGLRWWFTMFPNIKMTSNGYDTVVGAEIG